MGIEKVNKYKRWYDQLIERARDRQLDEYYERHHVLPRAMGGGNERTNLVRLTYREHFLAHWLLVKFTIGHDKLKMRHALSRMTHRKHTSNAIISGWQYDLARKSNREAMQTPEARAKVSAAHKGNQHARGYKFTPEQSARLSAGLTGNKNTLGYIPTAETRAKLSVASKGRPSGNKGNKFSAASRAKLSASLMGNQNTLGYVHTVETRAKLSAAMKGRIFTAETRARMSAASKGRKLSAAHKAKLSESRKGCKLSPEHLIKLSEGRKRYQQELRK
jgi:hypothetical protein